MKESFKHFISDSIVRYLVLGTIIAIGTSVIFTSLFYGKLPPLLPVFNQQPWGQEQIGKRVEIFLPIFIAFLIFLMNIIFSTFLYGKMPLAARLLCATSLLIAFFTLLFIIRTIILII